MRKTTLCSLVAVAALMQPRAAIGQEYDPPSQFELKNLLKELDVIRIKIDNLQKKEKAILKDLERAKAASEKWKKQYIQVKMRGELHTRSSGQLKTFTYWVLRVHGRDWPLDLRNYKTEKKKGSKGLLAGGRAVIVYGRMIPLPGLAPPGVETPTGIGDGFAILVEKIEPVKNTAKGKSGS